MPKKLYFLLGLLAALIPSAAFGGTKVIVNPTTGKLDWIAPTGTSGWPGNSSGCLANDGSGTLTYAACSGGSGGASSLETIFGTARSSPTATIKALSPFLGSVSGSTITLQVDYSSFTMLGASPNLGVVVPSTFTWSSVDFSTITASSATFTNFGVVDASKNHFLEVHTSTLPINGGFGPQPRRTYFWEYVPDYGVQDPAFSIVSSTSSFAAFSNSIYPASGGASLMFFPSNASGTGSIRFGVPSRINVAQFNSTGMEMYTGTKITLDDLTSQNCLGTDSSGNIQAGTCGGGGGSSSLAISSGSVQISSPTAILRFNGNDFNLALTGSATAAISLNPNTTNYIHNQSTLQSGATSYPDFLHVGSSASVEGAQGLTVQYGVTMSTFTANNASIIHTNGPSNVLYLKQDQFAGIYGNYIDFQQVNTDKAFIGVDFEDYTCEDGVTTCANSPLEFKNNLGAIDFGFDPTGNVSIGAEGGFRFSTNTFNVNGRAAIGNFPNYHRAPAGGLMVQGNVSVGTDTLNSAQFTVIASTRDTYAVAIGTSSNGPFLLTVDTTSLVTVKTLAGAGLSTCGDSTHALAWSSSSNLFTCQNVTGSGGPGGGGGGYNVEPATVTFNLAQGVIASTITATGPVFFTTNTILSGTTFYQNGAIVVSKQIRKRVVTVADATSITPNVDTSDIPSQTNTQATGTLTFNAPTGSPSDGQTLVIRVISTNSQTNAWNAAYSGNLPGSTSAGTNYYAFIYYAAGAVWHYTGGAGI